MSEGPNRKACDRCHSQKLSCKRTGDGVCDRCLRLNAECKSSPSLRYKKQLQQHGKVYEQKQKQPSSQLYQSQELLQQQQQQQQLQLQQQQQQQTRLQYSQGQQESATLRNVVDLEIQQHFEPQDSTEHRSPKRRRTGNEAHSVQREAATDATVNPGLQSHSVTAPDGSIGLAGYTMNLGDMNYVAMCRPPNQPNHLLGSQLLPTVDNYFNLHQVIPSLWPTQSHEETQQTQHPHLVQYHHEPQQQQDAFGQVSVAPLVVPDPSFPFQLGNFSSLQQQNLQHLQQQRATPVLSSWPRQAAVPVLSHSTTSCFPATERRSRLYRLRVSCTDFVAERKEDSLSELHVMEQLLRIYGRIQVLSRHLERLVEGKDYSDGPEGKPNEFTVSEFYNHTHQVVDILEHATGIKSGASTTASGGGGTRGPRLVDRPIDAGDLANGMFTVALYAKILDILQRLFTHARAVLAKADPKLDDTFAAWLLPEMNMSAASISAHPAFHMSLTVQLAMQFLSRLREATAFLGLSGTVTATNGNGTHGSDRAPPAGSAPHVSDDGDAAAAAAAAARDASTLSFANLKLKEGDLSKTLGLLQDELNEFMDTMDAIDAMAEDEKK